MESLRLTRRHCCRRHINKKPQTPGETVLGLVSAAPQESFTGDRDIITFFLTDAK